MDGETLTSEFPSNLFLANGANTMYTWDQTLSAENLLPDGVFQINVSSSLVPLIVAASNQAFSATTWALMPFSSNSVNCTTAAQGVLEAAGIQPYLTGTLWHSFQAPDLMLANLNVLSGQPNSGVVKLPGIPSNWSTSGLHP